MKLSRPVFIAAAFVAAVFVDLLFVPPPGPASAQQYGYTPVTTDAATHLIFKSTPQATLTHAVVANETSTAGFVIVYNSPTEPGSSLTANKILWCKALPASGSVDIDATPAQGINGSLGIVILVSSASGCATYTTGTITAFIGAL